MRKINDALIERELLAGRSPAYILGEMEAELGDGTADQPFWAILVRKSGIEPNAFKAGYNTRKAIIQEVKELTKGATAYENQP